MRRHFYKHERCTECRWTHIALEDSRIGFTKIVSWGNKKALKVGGGEEVAVTSAVYKKKKKKTKAMEATIS